MNDASTISNARKKIAEVLKAFDKADLALAVSYAQGWLACLLAAGLISKAQHDLLCLELDDARSQMEKKFDNDPSAPSSRPKYDL